MAPNNHQNKLLVTIHPSITDPVTNHHLVWRPSHPITQSPIANIKILPISNSNNYFIVSIPGNLSLLAKPWKVRSQAWCGQYQKLHFATQHQVCTNILWTASLLNQTFLRMEHSGVMEFQTIQCLLFTFTLSNLLPRVKSKNEPLH